MAQTQFREARKRAESRKQRNHVKPNSIAIMRRFVQAITSSDQLPIELDGVVGELLQADDRYNIGKGSAASVIALSTQGVPVVEEMQWGLVPRWSKEPTTAYTTVTARMDRAPKSRIFSDAWKRRHCVIPLSGYYKWDRQRKPHWPRFIQRQDGMALLAAGLWERWEKDDASLLSFTVLTGPNTAIPAPLTKDGPILLDPATALKWLKGGVSTVRTLQRRMPLPPLESYPVSRQIRNPQIDSYTLLEPVDPDAEGQINNQDEDEILDDED